MERPTPTGSTSRVLMVAAAKTYLTTTVLDGAPLRPVEHALITDLVAEVERLQERLRATEDSLTLAADYGMKPW